MEILQNFGFEPALFFAQIVNFLILAFIFKKFLYKPILAILKRREDEIKKGLVDAEKAHNALLSADEKKAEIINKAGLEAEKILKTTREEADRIKNEILTQAQETSRKIIDEANEQAKLEFQNSVTEAKKISLDVSQRVLDKVLSELFTAKEKEIILKRGMQKIKV